MENTKRTYAEAKGREPFNWATATQNAIDNGVTEVEHEQLEDKAGFWTTCACGNLCDIIPRSNKGTWIHSGGDKSRYIQIGEPIDHELATLGSDFNVAITHRNWIHAQALLGMIELRSAYLIDQIKNPIQPNE